jgi:DNA-binding NarL/FixJ family response regulator
MLIKVCLVADNKRFREKIMVLLNGAPQLVCTGVYADADEARSRIPAEQPDVAIMDVTLAGVGSSECVSRLKTRMPELEILMMGSRQQGDLIMAALRAGASGCLSNDLSADELACAIEEVHAGGAPLSTPIARSVIRYLHDSERSASEIGRISKRQRQILELLARGHSNNEIGRHLDITLSTVRAHLHVIFRTLRVKTRTQAVVKFLQAA